jgi:hypothetical protein
MADPFDTAHVVVATTSTIAGGGGMGLLVRFLLGRDAERKEQLRQAAEATTALQLALLTQKMDSLIVSVAKGDAMREDVALLKATYDALHRRIDRVDAELENNRREKERSHE